MNLTITKYPLSNVLRDLAHRGDSRAGQLLELLGYKDLRKGFRWFDRRANNGEVEPELFRAICGLYPEEKAALVSALEETRRIKDREELEKKRKEHSPSLWAETEREPYNFMSYCLARTVKQLSVPRVRLSEDEVAARIKKHCADYSGPEAERFGKVLRYRYEPEYGVCLYYATDGQRVQPESGRC
ncbi:MAG: hypothetical protein KDD69_13175 [Bdellovibrionales bacterium]|nr:hypothetical protein [Bdellovibrionales bacterium]